MREKLLVLLLGVIFTLPMNAQTTWSAKQPINTSTGDAPFTIASGLVDGDSKPDIVLGTNIGNTIEVYINTSTGPDDIAFAAPVLVTNTLSGIGGLALVDLDGINGPDIVATAYTNDILAWYPNNGSGGFPTENIISSSVLGASGLSFGTIDSGATIDIAVTAYDAGTVIWFANDGSGNFTGPNTIDGSITAPGSVNLKDVDNDGDLDALISTAQFTANTDFIEIYENDLVPGGSVAFTKSTSSVNSSGKTYFFNASFVDLDGDNNLDILATELNFTPGNGSILWYEDGDTDPFNSSPFTETSFTTTIANPSVAKHVDLDFDGDKDIIVSSGTSGTAGTDLAWYINDGAGNYGTENVIDATQSQAYVYTTADFDSDNDVDIASAAFNEDDLNAFENEKFVLSIGDAELNDVVLYPNPAHNGIYINGIQENYKVSIFNLLGQEVLNRIIEPNKELNIQSLRPGIYMLRIDEMNMVFKFIKR